jgi:hypothetical protein
MRRRLIVGTFAMCAAGSLGTGALDSVPAMRGADSLTVVTWAIIDGCADLKTYPTDNDPVKAGAQPVAYHATGSGNGEVALKLSPSTQLVAPMSRALGAGVCDVWPRDTAEGIVFALDALSVVFGPGIAGAEGLDYTGTIAGDPANNWRTVLRQVYTGMGASGTNVFARDCNSASRRALVDNWDNLFRGSTGSTCSDSNPDAGATNVEPGLRHAFRRDEESGSTDFFLAVLGLPAIDFQQTIFSDLSGDTIRPAAVPNGSNLLQWAVYRGLANSIFCNVRRPEDKNVPVNKGGSFIPPMYQVGLPLGAGGPTRVSSQGLVPFDPTLGENARFLAPYMPEMQDQDPIRRKCFGPKVEIPASPNIPREEVCAADGTLGLVLPISIPPGLQQSELFPSLPCEVPHDFEWGPAVTRPTGDPVRCPNGDAPFDGECLLPVRIVGAGFAFDCLNNGLHVPAAIFDSDGNGSEYPDAPTTDGRGDVDGRVYNLVLRAANGAVRTVARPNPVALGTMTQPVIGAFYRLHSSRSGLAAPNHTRTCKANNADDQIGCLVQLNACSMGLAGGGAVTNNPGTVATLVNGVAPNTATVQALLTGGTTYALARKMYLNTMRGFQTLLTSSDPGGVTGKDAELDLAECFAHLPFSTFANVGTGQLNVASFGLVPLPPPVGGGAPKAFCEDFNGIRCGDPSNTDACQNNTGLIPAAACDNGYRDGDEVGVDVCPSVRPTCNVTTHRCQ